MNFVVTPRNHLVKHINYIYSSFLALTFFVDSNFRLTRIGLKKLDFIYVVDLNYLM